MHTIYLALGSNIGNKKQAILNAIQLLSEKIKIEKKAAFYETKPWGFTSQSNFLNTVIKGKTELSPQELLVFVKLIEQKIGRVNRFTNGPREIDIDILFYDKQVLNTITLTIPHKGLVERDFVLQPLADISPNLLHPVLKKTIYELLIEISEEMRYILKKEKNS